MPPVSYPNPVEIALHPHKNMLINANCNADWVQLLEITEAGGSCSESFKGQGDGKAMVSSKGPDVIRIGPSTKTRIFHLRFKYQPPGSQSYSDATVGVCDVLTAGNFTTVYLGSEDSGKIDYNDIRAWVTIQDGLY